MKGIPLKSASTLVSFAQSISQIDKDSEGPEKLRLLQKVFDGMVNILKAAIKTNPSAALQQVRANDCEKECTPKCREAHDKNIAKYPMCDFPDFSSAGLKRVMKYSVAKTNLGGRRGSLVKSCTGWSCKSEGLICKQGSPGARSADFHCVKGRWKKALFGRGCASSFNRPITYGSRPKGQKAQWAHNNNLCTRCIFFHFAIYTVTNVHFLCSCLPGSSFFPRILPNIGQFTGKCHDVRKTTSKFEISCVPLDRHWDATCCMKNMLCSK